MRQKKKGIHEPKYTHTFPHKTKTNEFPDPKIKTKTKTDTQFSFTTFLYCNIPLFLRCLFLDPLEIPGNSLDL